MLQFVSNLPKKEAFFLTIDLLSRFSCLLVDDYQLSDDYSNHDFLNSFLSKNKIRQLRADVRKSIKYLNNLLEMDEYPVKSDFRRWQKIFDNWQKKLTKIHLNKFFDRSNSRKLEWLYLGTAWHFLLDTLYHLFSRFTETNEYCFWCNTKLIKPWSELLSEVITTNIPSIYVYLSLAQNTEDSAENIFGDLSLLFDAIINLSYSTPPCGQISRKS
jgi:hypothetical protein